jgi:hypothetical protein
MHNMKIKTIEHIYTIDGTESEVREYKRELQEKYETVDVYPTPFDHLIVCVAQSDTGCAVCGGKCSQELCVNVPF